MSDVKSYVDNVLKNNEWQSSGKVLHGKGGKVIGEGLIMRGNVNGHSIWVEGTKMSDGKIFVKNAGVD